MRPLTCWWTRREAPVGTRCCACAAPIAAGAGYARTVGWDPVDDEARFCAVCWSAECARHAAEATARWARLDEMGRAPPDRGRV